MEQNEPSLPTNTTTGARLLPEFLLGSGAWLWLWVLPVAILLALNAHGYWLVEGNMNPAQRAMAGWFGLAGVGNVLAGFVAFFVLRRYERKFVGRPAPLYYWGVASVLAQTAFLWFAVAVQWKMMPASVMVWIYTPDRYMFNQFAFAMLPLFHGVLVLAGGSRRGQSGEKFWMGLGLAVGAPLLCYLLVHGLFLKADVSAVAVAAIVVLLGLVMFVALVYVLVVGLGAIRRGGGASGERWVILMVAFALPIGGLLLNRSIEFPVDFQAWEVYALVVVNTLILLFASWKQSDHPLLSFCLLCATLPFSLYFFIVFLPYTPLSILAVIVVGLGFLVLTPTLLFVTHLNLLAQVLRGPLASVPARRKLLTGVMFFLLLPGFFTARGLADKAALTAALDYVYAPTVKAGGLDYPASIFNLRRALYNHRSYKNGIYYPLLSDYYGWLVFDNLVLPDSKLIDLENFFFGEAGSTENLDPVRRRDRSWRMGRSVRSRSLKPRATSVPQTVVVDQIAVRATPADAQTTVVTLALTLHNTGLSNAEYVKTLPLPGGVYVTGLRLHMNGTPVAGRIFERKTALWVYGMIRDSERRDPALLAYTAPGQVELRVYPVDPSKPSTVEVDFMVPAALARLEQLGSPIDPAAILTDIGRRLPLQKLATEAGTILVGVPEVSDSVVAGAVPYLHLIVDRSRDNGFDGDLSKAIASLKEKFPAARQMRITMANYTVVDAVEALTPLSEQAGSSVDLGALLPLRGGLALDLALAHAIRLHRDRDLDRAGSAAPVRPVFVVLSRKAAVRNERLPLSQRWAALLGQFELHEISSDGGFVTQFNRFGPDFVWMRQEGIVRPLTAGRAAWFPGAGNGAKLEYWSASSGAWLPVSGSQIHPANSVWSRAARLEAREQDYAFSPGDAGVTLKELVAESRASGQLLPETSYIAVENSAQWRTLESAEKTKLGKNAALEFVETPAPPAVYVALSFMLWLIVRHWRKLKQTCLAKLSFIGAGRV